MFSSYRKWCQISYICQYIAAIVVQQTNRCYLLLASMAKVTADMPAKKYISEKKNWCMNDEVSFAVVRASAHMSN